MEITLNPSGVVFDSVAHTYTLDGKELRGVTKTIRGKLFPDEYDGVPQAILDRAAERGKRVHSALELYDTAGICTEDCPELASYLSEDTRKGKEFLGRHIASEYIVTDGREYASGIDKVYAAEGGGVILADVKTTAKLDKEYVSWQLSVYAYLFGLQNPGVEVKGLWAVWLRGDKVRIEEVARKTEDEVKTLLYTDGTPGEDNQFAAMERKLYEAKKAADAAAAVYDAAKAEWFDAMREAKRDSYKGAWLSVTAKADTERKTFDSKAFKEDNPEVYARYVKTTLSKGGLLVRECAK